MKKTYKAFGIGSGNDANVNNVISKLDKAGISKESYRVNYFNINAEIVADKKIIKQIILAIK